MGIENDRKLIVNCLPLTEAERAQFIRAAKGMPQEFVGDSTQRGSMNWTAEIPDELKAYATAVIGNITPETCAQCPRLEWLQTWSAGVDKYQRPGVLHPGSMLTNATGAYGQSVSEHMFAMMWSIMKNLHIYAVGNPNAAWQDAGRVISPDGKTALIIGTGDIGSHFARLCKSVGMSTIGIRRNPTVEAPGIDHMVGFESLDDVLQYADVIAMCVPSTPSTHHLLNAERIAKLKTDAIVINAGRGDAIDTQEAQIKVTCAYRNEQAGSVEKTVRLQPGVNNLSLPLSIDSPHLWMPNGWRMWRAATTWSPPNGASSPSHWATCAATPTDNRSTTACLSRADVH